MTLGFSFVMRGDTRVLIYSDRWHPPGLALPELSSIPLALRKRLGSTAQLPHVIRCFFCSIVSLPDQKVHLSVTSWEVSSLQVSLVECLLFRLNNWSVATGCCHCWVCPWNLPVASLSDFGGVPTRYPTGMHSRSLCIMRRRRGISAGSTQKNLYGVATNMIPTLDLREDS